jgi:hypothetical protein
MGRREPRSRDDDMAAGYARGRQRDAEARAQLVPLAPGERPRAVTVAAVVALVMAAANVAAAIGGANLSEDDNGAVAGTVFSTAILVVAGLGMWRAKYWAVLGFQIVLAFQIVLLSIALLRVERWWTALGVVVAIGLLGWLFWKLIRAMARLQMPERPAS